MKQHITKEQWNQLRDKDVHILLDGLTWETNYPEKVITIGQMIKFLGDYWDWYVRENCIGMDSEAMLPEKICDNLFEAVKCKLKK